MKYIAPELEILYLMSQDVICDSDDEETPTDPINIASLSVRDI